MPADTGACTRGGAPALRSGTERYRLMTNERSVERTVLPNGLTILTERMENVRSVAMGAWVRDG